MLKSNSKNLVTLSVLGEVTSAVWPSNRQYRIGHTGELAVIPGTGGICYSHVIGDNATTLIGDHVEPGVSIAHSNANCNAALNTLACIGNVARIISGDAKGKEGIITGKHGGVEHVMVDFSAEVMESLSIGDKIQVIAVGTGLSLPHFSDIKVMNCSPTLLEKWDLTLDPKKKSIQVPVTHLVPAKIMGSGLGATTCHSGDYDIQLFDPQVVKRHRLSTLRFGDIVAIVDADHSYGRRYYEGAVSIGVIVHSDSTMSGHGPGVTTLLTSPKKGTIHPIIHKDANIGKILSLGRWR
jgi:hypothetical protein